MPSGWYQLLASLWSKMYLTPRFIEITGIDVAPHSLNLK